MAAKATKAQLEALWKQANPDLKGIAPVMAAIALAESKGEERVVNGIGACGYWQIHPYQAGCTDALTNAQQAGDKYRTQGLKAWESYSNGSYKQFLSKEKIYQAGFIGQVPLVGKALEDFLTFGNTKGLDSMTESSRGATQAAESAAGTAASVASDTGKLLAFLDKKEGWIRIVKVVGGVGILALAIDELIKGKPVISQVKGAIP